MLTKADLYPKASFSKDFIASPNFQGVMGRLNTGGLVINADGIGTTTATSTTVAIPLGGFADCRIVVVAKYVSPTTSGSESFGAALRSTGLEVSADTSYYYARIHNGEARISRFVNSSTSSTTLATAAWVLAQNTYATIDFRAVGSALEATFTSESGTPAPLTLSAVDGNITAGGFSMFRTTTSTGFARSIAAYQL